MWELQCLLLLSIMTVILLVGAQIPRTERELIKRSELIRDSNISKTSASIEPLEPLDYSAQMQSRAVDTRVTLQIPEGQPIGISVGRIPTKSGFTYRFNEPPKEFTLDTITGEIKTNAVLDREVLTNDRYDLVVLSSQPTYPIEVRIFVLDINDNAPEFPESTIAVSFSESAAKGTRLLLDTATDRDFGVNGVSNDYQIVGGDTKKFRLIVTDNPTGDTSYLHLETTGKLDRETQGFCVLNVSVRDGGNPPKYGYLQVNVTILDVNDNPPIFDHSDYIVSLNESVPPGTSVLQVMATDNDLGDNAKITYYLADTERQFTVDPESGIISTNEVLECPPQNCLQTMKPGTGCPKSCVFTVFARDHGAPRQDGRTYVTVNLIDTNDHDPIIRFRYFPATALYATVDENAVNGSVVAAVSVVDLDEGPNGDTMVRIVSGNELGHFRVHYTPSFDIVRVNGMLDREEISKYNLTVVATDKGAPPRTATAFLIIHVNDVNDHEPVFEKSEYSAILSELVPPGTYVTGITANDQDSGVNAQIHYAFVSGNEHNWFDITSTSGLVTTIAQLDREIQGTVEVNISARDGGPNPKWAFTQLKITILDENDEAPKFTQDYVKLNLSEDTPPHTLIVMMAATDHDQGTNGSVIYSFHSSVEQLYPNMFSLDSLTGQLTTKAKLDREKVSNYEIHIIAKDQGIPPQSSMATVFVNVLDVNDNSPEFYPQKYFLSVSEDTKIGASLLKVLATDLDEGQNAMITYKIVSGGDGLFSIDSWSGTITLIGNLRNSQKPMYKLQISAKDHGERKAHQDAIVEIIKETFMEEIEFDNYGAYEFQILEDHGEKPPKLGRDVGRVRVRSIEHVFYSITFGDPMHNFMIDEHTGKITTSNRIDREQKLHYMLTVTVRSGLSYGKTTVNIVVMDLNDNKPMFLRDNDGIKLAENAAVGQEVYLARARDLDFGINSRITYILSYNTHELFRISEASGIIYLNRPIRAEPGTILYIEVTAVDGGTPKLSCKRTISVTIEDVNDHTPIFDHTSYETSLLETTPVNSRFFALTASDADLGDNGKVSYEITEGNSESKFGIFPDGYLFVRNMLNREVKDYYSLTVAARDCGIPSRYSVVPVVIHVIDENDNAPEFTNSTFTFSVRENEPPETFVGKLTASDRDIGRNAELVFSLSNSQSNFVVDPKNGFIKTVTVFDREQLVQSTGQDFVTLEASVLDNGTPRLLAKVKIKVQIIDVNDNPPKFLRVPYNVQVSESSAIGTQVVRLYTTDADNGLNGDVYYTIASGNDDGRFEIDAATGQITLVRQLDRETTSKYNLLIIAQDAGLFHQLNSTTYVSIEVFDYNDNAPQFALMETKISVLETAIVNAKLVQFHATDVDVGINGEVSFSITAGNKKDTFRIDPFSGVLYLHKMLDYEELTLYQLNITASDNGSPQLSNSIIFLVNVGDANDNPPIFPSTAIVRQIREGISIRTPIVTVTAEDPDSGINGQVIYSIDHQEPHNDNRYFEINSVSGVIHTLLPIDRETIDTFRLTVLATDQAQPHSARLSTEKLVTVIVEDVNDNAPIFVSMNAAVLPPYSTHNGSVRDETFIMNIFARDLDSSTNGLVTYDLTSGNNDLFLLKRSTGILTLKKPIVAQEYCYQLTVKATDEAVQSERKSADAYITVITSSHDKGPIFDSETFSGSVYENERPGTSILTVSAKYGVSDIEYYITNVTGDGVQVDRLFDIDTKLGVLSTAVELDRETGIDTYIVEVYAIVVGVVKTSKTKVKITILDKNDSPPLFKNTVSHYTVSEDAAPGHQVAIIKAEDSDTIGTLTYTLISNGDDHFALDKFSGRLQLIETVDRETRDQYKLTIRGSDGIQHSSTTIVVEVVDTNDNLPIFSENAYSFDVPENAVRGTRVGQVFATDTDLGMNAQLTYAVISDWANDVFSLNPQTGAFTLTARLDYELVQHYILVVQAQDSGSPALSSTVTVFCNVLDLNDNAPIFDPMSYSNEIYENISISTTVVTVSATDMDSGENKRIVYSISGDPNEDFSILANGSILTNKPLDRETCAIYNLIVTATDQAIPPERRLFSSVQVTITLRDVNDMSPEFISLNETSVLENIPLNTVVMAIKAVDKDEGRNGYIEYFLLNNSSYDGVFSLGPVDGLLRVSANIDRETQPNFTLLVMAKDRGEPPRSSQTTVIVTVLDENDNSPVFDPKQYSASIAENASIGTSVLQVSATDIDANVNGHVRYSISAGDKNRDFNIAEDTGVVRVAKNLNYERKSRYLLTVKAEDCAGDVVRDIVRTDFAEISLSISDINDNPPTFLDSPYLAYVMENVIPPNGGYIITVQAYDADSPPFNNLVKYFIKEGDTDLFKINASSGDIALSQALDREVQEEYSLSLVAMDTGSPPLIGSGTVKIIVQDVNDHSPEFQRQFYYATIIENAPVDSWVLTVSATDKDVGANARVRYSILGEKVDRFKIDSDIGTITTTVSLDREESSVYYLTLMAQDCSATEPRATTVNLTIAVFDENDNSPKFSTNNYDIYISDQTKSGQFVFGAKAMDMDVGINSEIKYTLRGTSASNFTIESDTGIIKAINELSTKSVTIFKLEIEAKDCGEFPNQAIALLKVHLKPSHLFPTFTDPIEPQFMLAENVEEGKLITTVKAVSPKKGTIGNIRFAIAGGNSGEAIKIDKITGKVQITGKGLDYEVSSQYVVWIEATDSDKPPLTSVMQMIINLTDANDNVPVFANSLYNATVLEEESPPVFVTELCATDIDSGENGQISYKLIDDHGASFEIDPDTGRIYTNTKLDREEISSYELVVKAVDQGSPPLTGSTTLLVTVLDKNDNPPTFTRLLSVNVTENTEIGSFVIRVTTTDQDIGENARATYSFTENPGSKFSIDQITGNVTVVGALDREQQDEYLLKVAAVDRAWRAETPLTITIQDQNDNTPEFDHSYYSFNLPELQQEISFVGQVTASDRDKQGPNSVISYSFQQPSDLFTIDPATGDFFTKRSLKYKSTLMESPENVYSVNVVATDNGKPPLSSECLVVVNLVDANNNSPKFEHKQYLSSVPEDAVVGQQLLQVTALDTLDFGINAEIGYSFVSGNGTSHFVINKITGWITLGQPIAKIGTTYVLNVQAVDKGFPPQEDEAVVILIVSGNNRHSPLFTALSYQVIVPENEPVGSTILTVSASDEDEGPNGIVRYQISAGNEKKEFAIDHITGSITILESLDYDKIQEYRLNITATDLGYKSRKTVATLTVTLTDINDNAPVFNQTHYEAWISENRPVNTFVCRLIATDIDSTKNSVIQYSIENGTGKDAFAIDQTTGIITTKASFDYEDTKFYHIRVIAINPNSSMYNTTEVLIHVMGVNEYYPKFVHPVFHFEVSESTEIGTVIGMVQATDQDAGEDGKIYYLFVGASNDRGFSIKSETGIIAVSRNLDRETQSRIVLTVMAKNMGGIRGNDTDEAQIIVTVQDGNDPPEFVKAIYEATISEGVPVGTSVLVVKAIDKDVRPQNNQFSYSIMEGNIEQVFKIDPHSGIIETERKLDRETFPEYSIVIGAIDSGMPPETGTTIVKIYVSDINDNGPVLDSSDMTGFIMENEPPMTSILTLSAKDPDLPPNGAPFSYKVVGGKHKDFLQIDKHTGVLQTTRSIDREITPVLEIIIEVSDSGTPTLKTQYNIKVNVMDENDSPSTPRSVHVLVHAFETDFPLSKIADLHPNDPDITGDYKCKIVQGPVVSGILTMPSACNLEISRITPGQGYSLSISGNDGKHADVISSATIEFISFTNVTISNSITMRIENITAQQFLINYYQSLMELMKTVQSPSESVLLYALNENDNSLDLTIALKNYFNYKDKLYIADKLNKRKDAIMNLFHTLHVTIDYSPCKRNTCEHEGICTEAIRIKNETRITDSPNLIFTSPLVVQEYYCQCLEGYIGKDCNTKQDPCIPNPCKWGGQCRKQGFHFQCVCPPTKEGRFCDQEKGNVCSENPCHNGGSCRHSSDGSFFCLCRPGYRGNQCETVVDSCRPNPCLNGGHCVSLKPDYKCSCSEGRYGRHCEKSTYGFKELSYMIFPSLDAATNDISFIFSTTKPNSLLIYNYGLQSGGRSDFVAIELRNGRAVFSFGGVRTAITSISIDDNVQNFADGNWHKITATRNGRVISLSTANCSENGDICEECQPGDSSCFIDATGPIGTLNFNNQPLLVGGLNNADAVLERPGQIHTDDFIGCVHSISINGRALNLSGPIASEGIENTCSRKGICAAANPCSGDGICLDHWSAINCNCGNDLIAPNCGSALQPVSIGDGGFLEFIISKKHRRIQLLDYGYVESIVQVNDSTSKPAKSVSLIFRTLKPNGLIFYATSNKHFTAVELVNGHIAYISKLSAVVNMTCSNWQLNDGLWHNVTLHSQGRSVNIFLDKSRIGDELDATGVHDFLDPYLTHMALGGTNANTYLVRNSLPEKFEGCFANFTINNEIQPFNGLGSIFREVALRGKVNRDCIDWKNLGVTSSPDPLSIGITLVIVFFVVLLIAILASFIAFRLRKQNKEQTDSSGNTSEMLAKQNGNNLINSSNNDNVIGRSLHATDNALNYNSENGDVIRGMAHLLVGPELLSKKFKDRDLIQSEVQRPQRPDIIEREVVNKSALVRDEHPPLPPNHAHDHVTADLSSEIPEHYDLENASSIAPSDIDIVYHYKGFREATGVRKYKATPPPMNGYHHKHIPSQTQSQHRHSSHHPTVFPPRAVTVNNPNARTHQSTPLARLSPSSEMSAQQPRILTLHDISGKPLQTALLATTSSSGGVGKDVLHSNSERSLNSPVMSQLSGQSSGSHKPGAPPQVSSGSPGIGLTAEEIERLNSRPRTSSLVSTLDAVSSSSEAPRVIGNNHVSHLRHSPLPETHQSSTTTDESGNDSFTCSEIEYDNASLCGDKFKTEDSDSRRNESKSIKSPLTRAPYGGFDPSYRGSMSTLVASDDEISSPLYRPPTGSPSTTALSWDYLLNWGPNFESLVGVFKDIAQLPDSMNGRVSSIRIKNVSKPSEEYV